MSTPDVVPAHPPEDADWFSDDPALTELLAMYVDEATLEAATPRLETLGKVAPGRIDELARLADRHRPELHRRSPEGERIDEVEFHPAYHEIQALAREHEVFTLPWRGLGDHEQAPRTLGFALGYLFSQAEGGYYCPACMTDGAAFVLDRHAPEPLADRLIPRLVQEALDGAYEGAMYLTEKGGGSDVGGGTATVAEQAEDGSWRLTGEKWFASNCVADVALALARMPGTGPEDGTRGLGLFVVPRHLEDGTRNPGVKIERLKDKLGVTSMPTGEVLLEEAVAYLVKGPGEGFKAMAEMVNLSRLYNAVTSVAVMRRALREGQRVGGTREAFGKPLREHPLFLRDLIELTVETEAALAFVLDTADRFDTWAAGDDEARRLMRILTPCAKAATAKLSVSAASRGCEFLGGQGYIEEYVTPRLLRDAQVLPIWEGTTNIQCLDLLRSLAKEQALEVFIPHVQAQLEQAPDAGAEQARQAVVQALGRIQEEAGRLAKADRARAEATSRRFLELAYHTHACALLVRRLATAEDRQRAERVAEIYAAMYLDADREAGDRALEEAAAEGWDEIAYPA